MPCNLGRHRLPSRVLELGVLDHPSNWISNSKYGSALTLRLGQISSLRVKIYLKKSDLLLTQAINLTCGLVSVAWMYITRFLVLEQGQKGGYSISPNLKYTKLEKTVIYLELWKFKTQICLDWKNESIFLQIHKTLLRALSFASLKADLCQGFAFNNFG